MLPKSLLFVLCSMPMLICSAFQPGNARLKRILLVASPDSKEIIRIEKEYEYDGAGRISKVTYPLYTEHGQEGVMSYDLYEYSASGRLVRIMTYNANINSPAGFITLKNISYTYSDDGNKEKEGIEYPQANLSEYSLYRYESSRLVKIEKYGYRGALESYIANEYDESGNLVKESKYNSGDQLLSQTVHLYSDGLNVRSDVYIFGDRGSEHLREIIRTYDDYKNMVTLESKELLVYSSQSSFVKRFEYYEH